MSWVEKKLNSRFHDSTAIGWERSGQLIAGVVYNDWNRVNVVCHIASDGSRRWMTREYLWTIFDFPFNQLGVKRITVYAGERNAASREFVEHLGFTFEASLAKAHPTGDLFIYRMFADECRYAEVKRNEKKVA